ncbi:ubiquitin-like-conjugating enzyme ATG10 isoform X3 [Heptranchias perlo]|uniref:ubiquitin-like-conjugating enzyme ATG10 isoform X3 n=1 Tax=Heptranchias perlo TaxID=212740 RepID=UPI0035599C64
MKKQYGLVLNFGHVNIRIFPDWEAIHSVCLQMSNNFNQNENICLGKQQFQQFCKLFIRHSDEIHNGWEWRQKELNEGYMVKVHLRSKNSKNNSVVGDHCLQSLQCLEAESLSEEEVNLENVSNDTEEAQVTTSELIRYEYHVVYSSSYQAPVLYFRACYSDGRPLALKEIWENVHDCYKERLFQGPWDTITQQPSFPLCGGFTSDHTPPRCHHSHWY